MTLTTRLASRLRGARAPARRTLLLAAALAMAGCTSPAFRQSVGQFGTLTKAAVTAQNARLAGIVADDTERIRAQRAAGRVDLQLDPACAATLAADPGTPAAICRLTGPGGAALEEPLSVNNVLALGAALNGYADSLIALAADSTQDQQAFSTSVNGLATSLGKLEGEVRLAAGSTGNVRAQIGAVASVVAEAGGLYFAARRSLVLRRMVRDADPIVQRAVGLLVGVQDRVALYDRAGLFQQLVTAQRNASRLANTGASAADLRTAQNQLYVRLQAYNNYGADLARFRAIGAAHAKLAEAARAGASPEQMAAAIEAILDLAATVHDSVETLSGDGGNDASNPNNSNNSNNPNSGND